DQRKGEDRAPAVAVGEMAEKDRADEQSGEQGEDECPYAGHPIGREHAERTERFRREIARLEEARRDIGGQEKVVELKAAAERDQRDQHPDMPRHRQPVEPGGELRRACAGHSVSSHSGTPGSILTSLTDAVYAVSPLGCTVREAPTPPAAPVSARKLQVGHARLRRRPTFDRSAQISTIGCDYGNFAVAIQSATACRSAPRRVSSI